MIQMRVLYDKSIFDLKDQVNKFCQKYDVIDFQILTDLENSKLENDKIVNRLCKDGYYAVLKVRAIKNG